MGETWSREEQALLGRTGLFEGTEEPLARAAAEDPACSRAAFSKGEAIYSPKRFRRSLGVLLTGKALVTKGELVVSTLGPGDLFGAAALFHSRPDYETTITAREDCAAAFFPQELVLELMRRSPAFMENYIRYLSGRIHFLSQRLDGLTAPGGAGRLYRYLLSEGGRVSCPGTELARRLDVSRATLYRAFDALERAGAIRRDGKTVELIQDTQKG